MPGWQEILVIALVVVVLFGGKIPELARGLGKAMNEFKRAKSEIKDEIEKTTDSSDQK